jgi:hypothetical protein
MRLALALVLLVPLLLAAPPTTVVPLEIRDGGYLHVPVRLADARPALLMLDTAAGINTLAPDLIRELGGALRSAGVHSGTRHNGETVTGPVWTLSTLQLGSIVKRDVLAGAFAPPGADGLLSLDFFRDLPFTLDLARGQLTVETAGSLSAVAREATVVPIRLREVGAHQLDVFVDICVGDVRADAEFDTGAGFAMLMMQPAYMARLGLRPDTARPRGPFEYYVHSTTLPLVHYCDAPAVATRDQFVGFKEGLIYQALIGHGAFRGRRLTIDIPRRRLLVR